MTAVKIAGAPISWGVCEVPGWGLQLSPERVLGEMVSLGITATKFGPVGFLPEDPEGRRDVLAQHQMTAVGGFLPVVLHDPDQDPMPEVLRELEAFVAAGAEVMVLAANTRVDGYDQPRPTMTDAHWETLASNLAQIEETAKQQGILAVIHPHAGTMVETADDVQKVLDMTTSKFCLDTGHMFIGGVDPVAFATDHGDRVGHVRFKDIRLDIAKKVQTGELTYYDAVVEGVYTPLGQGDVDVRAITQALTNHGYQGWYVLEQDLVVTSEPNVGEGPVTDAKASVEFLREALSV
jgi:inosose dehydratase